MVIGLKQLAVSFGPNKPNLENHNRVYIVAPFLWDPSATKLHAVVLICDHVTMHLEILSQSWATHKQVLWRLWLCWVERTETMVGELMVHKVTCSPAMVLQLKLKEELMLERWLRITKEIMTMEGNFSEKKSLQLQPENWSLENIARKWWSKRNMVQMRQMLDNSMNWESWIPWIEVLLSAWVTALDFLFWGCTISHRLGANKLTGMPLSQVAHDNMSCGPLPSLKGTTNCDRYCHI